MTTILSSLFSKVFVVSSKDSIAKSNLGNNVTLIEVSHNSGGNSVSRVLNYLLTSIRLTLIQASLLNKADMFVFFIGGETLILQMLFLKLHRKEAILVIAGTPKKISAGSTDIFLKGVDILTSINFLFADKLIVYSKTFIRRPPLCHYSGKAFIAHEHFIDFSQFGSRKVKRKTQYVGFKVGFIGRFSPEKGILNFLDAIPRVIAQNPSITFLVGGSGPLKEEIIEFVRKNGLSSKVQLENWIPHEKLTNYLSELDLLVIPSFTEGLPNILLEAMACGTPVIATNVGAIPDLIKDNENGFLLNSNNPQYMANRIIEIVGKPELLRIVGLNSRFYVRKNYTFEKTVTDWANIFECQLNHR